MDKVDRNSNNGFMFTRNPCLSVLSTRGYIAHTPSNGHNLLNVFDVLFQGGTGGREDQGQKDSHKSLSNIFSIYIPINLFSLTLFPCLFMYISPVAAVYMD